MQKSIETWTLDEVAKLLNLSYGQAYHAWSSRPKAFPTTNTSVRRGIDFVKDQVLTWYKDNALDTYPGWQRWTRKYDFRFRKGGPRIAKPIRNESIRKLRIPHQNKYWAPQFLPEYDYEVKKWIQRLDDHETNPRNILSGMILRAIFANLNWTSIYTWKFEELTGCDEEVEVDKLLNCEKHFGIRGNNDGSYITPSKKYIAPHIDDPRYVQIPLTPMIYKNRGLLAIYLRLCLHYRHRLAKVDDLPPFTVPQGVSEKLQGRMRRMLKVAVKNEIYDHLLTRHIERMIDGLKQVTH